MSLMECVNHMYHMQKEAKEMPMLYLIFSQKDYQYSGTAVYTASQANDRAEKGSIVLEHTYFDGMNLSTDNRSVLEKRCKEIIAAIKEGGAHELCPGS